jgi:hypothetical protein
VNLRRILIVLAALTALCGCSSSSASSTAQSSSSASPSPSQSPCQAKSDSVQPGLPLIQVSPVGSTRPITLTKKARLACYTTLNVTQGGSATAMFGTVAWCLLTQVGSPYGNGVGTLVSRYPNNMLFSLNEGAVSCATSTAKGQQAQVCGKGTVHITAVSTNWDATCTADHLFQVAVYSGSVQVDYPGGKATLNAFSQVAVDPSTRRGKVSTGISFSAAEIGIFNSLEP